MLILVTNDDGIDAPSLFPLKKALDRVAQTLLFAPDHNWSAAGHPKTMHKPLRADRIELPDGSFGFVSTAPPSDCVALALLGLSFLIGGLLANPGCELTALPNLFLRSDKKVHFV